MLPLLHVLIAGLAPLHGEFDAAAAAAAAAIPSGGAQGGACPLPAPAPMLLYGYGSYGICIDMRFDSQVLCCPCPSPFSC